MTRTARLAIGKCLRVGKMVFLAEVEGINTSI